MGNPETNFMVCACQIMFYKLITPLRIRDLFLLRICTKTAMLTLIFMQAPGEPNSQVAYGTPQVAHTASI